VDINTSCQEKENEDLVAAVAAGMAAGTVADEVKKVAECTWATFLMMSGSGRSKISSTR
jgi:hypothetical protein